MTSDSRADLFSSVGEPLGSIFSELDDVAGLLKQALGHNGPEHFGWSTMAVGYRIDPAGYGYPTSDPGWIVLCECGEILSVGAGGEAPVLDEQPRLLGEGGRPRLGARPPGTG